MGRVKPLRLEDISDNTPLRLAVAAEIAFPDGSISASSLRKERDAGRLIVERIAGKEYTTLANIQEMRRLCRAQSPDLGSGENPKNTTRTENSAVMRRGSSEMAEKKSAQAYALAVVSSLQKKPSKPSGATSSKAGERRASATVTPLRS